MKYMMPMPETKGQVYSRIKAGKATDKESLKLSIIYSKDYREYWQEKQTKWDKEVDAFEQMLKTGTLTY